VDEMGSMGEMIKVYSILNAKPEGKRSPGGLGIDGKIL
jgi:hypothetical protein